MGILRIVGITASAHKPSYAVAVKAVGTVSVLQVSFFLLLFLAAFRRVFLLLVVARGVHVVIG